MPETELSEDDCLFAIDARTGNITEQNIPL
jgi:hypothetical protein